MVSLFPFCWGAVGRRSRALLTQRGWVVGSLTDTHMAFCCLSVELEFLAYRPQRPAGSVLVLLSLPVSVGESFKAPVS